MESSVVRGGPLLSCLLAIAHFHNHPISEESALAGLPLVNGLLTPSVFNRAAKRANLASRICRTPLSQLNPALLPAILLLKNNKACILHALDLEAQTVEVEYPELSDSRVQSDLAVFESDYLGQLIYVRPEFRFDTRAPKVKQTHNLHWFWGVVKQNRGLYRDVIIASLMINLFALAMPLFALNVYDRVVPNHATHTLWVLAFGMLIVLLFDLALKLLRTWFVDLGASRADVKLSSTLMEQVLDMKLAHRPASTGSFANQLYGFQSLRSFISSLTLITLVDLPFVLLFLLVIGLINWVLILPVLVGGTLILLYAFLSQAQLRQLSESTMQAEAMRNGSLVESLSNLETVKSFNLASRIQNIWETATIFLARQSAKSRFISSSVSSSAQWTQQIVGVSVIIVGVYLIIDGQLTQGGLIAAYMISTRAISPISQTAGLIAQFYQASTALNALNQVMDTPVERPAGRSWVNRPVFAGDIEFKGVNFRYPDDERLALIDVHFQIKAGERVAILGRNGSGKSTLEKLILGLYQPESGSVLLDGVDLRQLDPAELRRQIGYVPQDVSLFFGTLKDNLISGHSQADDAQIIRAANLSGLAPFINSHPAGFNLPVGEGGQRLSGGQRQAVGIGRALLNDPPILLLDEPTASLDHAAEEQIKQQLAKISAAKTLLVITHRSSLLNLVERIIVIDHGRIVADGPKLQVMEALKQGRIGSAR